MDVGPNVAVSPGRDRGLGRELAAEGYRLAQDSGGLAAIAFMSAVRGLLQVSWAEVDIAILRDAARGECRRGIRDAAVRGHGGPGLRDRRPVDGRCSHCTQGR